jgi:hypothetical protein
MEAKVADCLGRYAAGGAEPLNAATFMAALHALLAPEPALA